MEEFLDALLLRAESVARCAKIMMELGESKSDKEAIEQALPVDVRDGKSLPCTFAPRIILSANGRGGLEVRFHGAPPGTPKKSSATEIGPLGWWNVKWPLSTLMRATEEDLKKSVFFESWSKDDVKKGVETLWRTKSGVITDDQGYMLAWKGDGGSTKVYLSNDKKDTCLNRAYTSLFTKQMVAEQQVIKLKLESSSLKEDKSKSNSPLKSVKAV